MKLIIICSCMCFCCLFWPTYWFTNSDVNMTLLYYINTVIQVSYSKQVLPALQNLGLHVFDQVQKQRFLKMAKNPESKKCGKVNT